MTHGATTIPWSCSVLHGLEQKFYLLHYGIDIILQIKFTEGCKRNFPTCLVFNRVCISQ